MTLKEEIVKWNNTWRYDFWWRQKYNIAFGSKEHKEASQIDIAFEYFENHMYNKAVKSFVNEEKKEKKLKETGSWISERKLDKSESDRLWNQLDLSKLQGL